MPTFRIKEAASLGEYRHLAPVGGRIDRTVDTSGPVAIEATALAKLAQELAESAGHGEKTVVVAHSARNTFSGHISRVTRDTVMAQVEIQAGPHGFVSQRARCRPFRSVC